jgi:hypothetical protein
MLVKFRGTLYDVMSRVKTNLKNLALRVRTLRVVLIWNILPGTQGKRLLIRDLGYTGKHCVP